jgi:hypothetical protein
VVAEGAVAEEEEAKCHFRVGWTMCYRLPHMPPVITPALQAQE